MDGERKREIKKNSERKSGKPGKPPDQFTVNLWLVDICLLCLLLNYCYKLVNLISIFNQYNKQYPCMVIIYRSTVMAVYIRVCCKLKCTKCDAEGGGALLNNNSGPMQFTAFLFLCPSSSFPVTELLAVMRNNNMYCNRFAEAEVW